jgi:hypothetical protein
MKKNDNIHQPWLEIPFTMDMERFFSQDIIEEDLEYSEKMDNLKALVIETAIEVLTDVQLSIFIMRFVFKMKYRDIANNLKSSKKKRLQFLSHKKMCQGYLKRQKRFINRYKKELAKCMTYVKSFRRTREKEICIYINTTSTRFRQLKNSEIADRMAKRNLKNKYNNSVTRMVRKVKKNPELIEGILDALPNNITASGVMGIVKWIIEKLKENLNHTVT